MSQFVSFLSQNATAGEAHVSEFCLTIQTLTMNILEQMLAIVALVVSGVGIRTIFSAVALRRRLK